MRIWHNAEVCRARPPTGSTRKLNRLSYYKIHSNDRNEETNVAPAKTGDLTNVWKRRLLHTLGALGVLAAFPFFAWFALGWLEVVPSLVDTFGVVGLRTPASITVGGLLLAAIGFYDS